MILSSFETVRIYFQIPKVGDGSLRCDIDEIFVG